MNDQERVIGLLKLILMEAEEKGVAHIAVLARSALVLLQSPPTLGVSVSDEAAAKDKVG